MVLIIAEKPSLGRNIAAALGAKTRGEGCLTGGNYIVTWAFGHLFSLADVEAYSENETGSKWTLDNLPCFPDEFRFQLRPAQSKGGSRSKKRKTPAPDEGVKKQYALIRDLCRRADVDTIVNAGDADREGEIIVRLILQHAVPDTNKKLMRLWLPDQTEQTIRAAAAALEPETKYDSLANEGFARTYVDWLYGVNLTRYASIRTGKLLRVGRVIIPIVKAIYDRDMEIRNFVPKPYLSVASKEKTKGAVVELVSKKEFDADEKGRSEAQALCDLYNSGDAVVSDLKKKKEIIQPGKLYSLSKLQNVLGKKYKMSMDKSLSILQKLYEEGYVTYPRTNSEYLATAEKDKIKKILEGAKNLGYPVEFKDKKTIFDDSKIESHSALTPTYKIPSKDKLTPEEMEVYSTIFRRFAAVFCSKDCVAEKTEMTIDVKSKAGELYERFTLRGTVIIEQGWMKFDDAPQKFKVLPPLEIGDPVKINFKPIEKATEPPRHYTIETLNNYLKNPFKEEKSGKMNVGADGEELTDSASDVEDYRAIFEGLELGTEATRTGIIDNARKSEYIKLTKDVYTILPDGEFLIESLQKMMISMDKYKTSTLGKS
ncbi:MAG: DNA topoisomerase, partial [Clostridia bacterium]|nr:DNA topoisomerase [Clostridia bacterium]